MVVEAVVVEENNLIEYDYFYITSTLDYIVEEFVKTYEEVESNVSKLLGKEIYGLKIDKLLIYHMVPEGKEIYLGFTVDRSAKKYVAIASSAGGMDIEEVAEKAPEKIVKELRQRLEQVAYLVGEGTKKETVYPITFDKF